MTDNKPLPKDLWNIVMDYHLGDKNYHRQRHAKCMQELMHRKEILQFIVCDETLLRDILFYFWKPRG